MSKQGTRNKRIVEEDAGASNQPEDAQKTPTVTTPIKQRSQLKAKRDKDTMQTDTTSPIQKMQANILPDPDVTGVDVYDDMIEEGAVIRRIYKDKETTRNESASQKSKENEGEMALFYTSSHYWEDVCPPQTIVVARSMTEASSILQKDLNNTFGFEGTISDEIWNVLPISTAGVCILSIGLGEVENLKEEFESRPIIRKYQSESTDGKLSYYICTSHYTSIVTPAATVILASSRQEATTFLLTALKEIGVPESQDLIVNVMKIDKPTAYYLGRKKVPQSVQPNWGQKEVAYAHGKPLYQQETMSRWNEESRPTSINYDSARLGIELGLGGGPEGPPRSYFDNLE